MRYRLRRSDDAAAERLIALGQKGVGGVHTAGSDGDGSWVERTEPEPLLSSWMRDLGAIHWRDAVALVASLADAAAACEQASLFPGTLTPDGIAVRDGALEIRADALVGALLGQSCSESPAPVSARWMSPEQAAGMQPDNAGNRYVIGLILYRLVTGEHAFSGQSLRHRIEDQARRGAAPFPEAVATAVVPGLESLCLRILDADAGRRPESAAAIARELRQVEAGAGAGGLDDRQIQLLSRPWGQRPTPPSKSGNPDDAASVAGARHRRRGVGRGVLAGALVVSGLAVGALSIASVDAPGGISVRDVEAMTEARTVADCAGCHARQTGQWHRSVMAHSVKSPLFGALEILIQEQVGRDVGCPDGAGILRRSDPQTACRDRASGLEVTGSGGEHWCVNCHAPGENLVASMPAWDGVGGSASSRLPLPDLLPESSMEGISCAFCHQVEGPVRPGNFDAGLYEGNPFWTSTRTGTRFSKRPEDRAGLFGIANSGYLLDPTLLISGPRRVPGDAHSVPSEASKRYLRSSEFCGSCHDVRLFGTDVIGARKGEHFKRLRNAYSEWVDWSEKQRAAGREPATCQDCHMSSYPGICVPGSGSTIADRACPPGTRFSATEPGTYPSSRSSAGGDSGPVTTHYFSGVDIPLTGSFARASIDDPTLDTHGIPLGARQRRDLLLARTFELSIDGARTFGSRIEVPVILENTGAGHRVPAGFSQEREFWIHVRITDARGRLVYEVGRVDRHDEDLRDKIFSRVTTDDRIRDALDRPLGMFGADVIDGPDLPRWSPDPDDGGTRFRGEGLINLQNGFLRCVRCIGTIDENGDCQPRRGQGATRADRYADGGYDPDTGQCISNLRGDKALFEVYFPVGALDATRGVVRGPDAIIDTRSAPPGVPLEYTYELPVDAGAGPFQVEARLMFRAFPPFLLRAFADYEARQDRLGLRPSGPVLTRATLDRLEIVEIANAKVTVP